MPAAKPPRSRLAPVERKARLVEATLHCLKHYGFQGASVRRICAQAGGSVGLINHHYASKDELVAESYLHLNRGILQRLHDAAQAAQAQPRAQLTAIFEASFSPEMLSHHLLEVWIGFWGAVRATEAMQAAHDLIYAQYREGLATHLRGLADEMGWHDFEAPLAAIALNALLDGLWLESGLNPSTFSPQQGLRMCEAWVDGLVCGAHKAYCRV